MIARRCDMDTFTLPSSVPTQILSVPYRELRKTARVLTDELFTEMISVPDEELTHSGRWLADDEPAGVACWNRVNVRGFLCPWDQSVTIRPIDVWLHKNKVESYWRRFGELYVKDDRWAVLCRLKWG
jgi:hypothetical protein